MSKTVIAIEDDPHIAELLKLVMASDDLTVLHYSDGELGLAGVFEHKPALVILDIMVPGLNGWEIYDRIRANEELKSTPIIILSVTQQTFERRIDFAHSTIDFYFSKPFDILPLRNKMRDLLNVESWQVGSTFPARKTEPPPTPSRRIDPALLTEKKPPAPTS